MNTPHAAVPAGNLAEQITDLLKAGGTLGDVYDYSDHDYEVLYALGHSLYTQGRYLDAMKAFGFLVMHNHLERRFMNAFASSLQMLKSYEEAISYYSMASVMDMRDPAPTFHTAECLLALGRAGEAHEALTLVVKQCGKPEQASLKERALALMALIANRAQPAKGASA